MHAHGAGCRFCDAGYGLNKPDQTGRWEVSVYMWTPSQIIVNPKPFTKTEIAFPGLLVRSPPKSGNRKRATAQKYHDRLGLQVIEIQDCVLMGARWKALDES